MKKKTWLVRPIAVAVSSCFGIASSWGNPTGPQIQGPAGGGMAGLQQGANTGAQTIAANNSTNETRREQDELDRTLEEAKTREEERQRRGARLCS